MPEIIESLKQGAGQVLSSIDQKGQIKSTIEGLRRQLSDLERRRRVSLLENQIKALEGEARQLTEALGLQTLSLFDAGKIRYPELTRTCERINELRAQAKEKKEELARLKSGARSTLARCPQCGAEVTADAAFCPKCGARLRVAPSPAAQPRKVVRLRCPRCKTILPPQAAFCPTCGVKIKMPADVTTKGKHFCAACGAELGPSARFCPVCGRATSTG